MKILYAIQGTGNGHLARAYDIVPLLQQKAELDVLISGVQADISVPFPVKYRMKGMSFIFGKKGGVDLIKTWENTKTKRFVKEVKSLPVEEYDLVINDFEPVSAWACNIKHVPCIGLSHQSAVLDKYSPKAKNSDLIGRLVLNFYAPTTVQYGFHFRAYAQNIFTPVIRKQVRNLKPENKGHYTVYLPAYNDKRIIEILQYFPYVDWEVFSKHNKEPYQKDHISVFSIDNDKFIQSMATAEGVLCGAGFETPAEALYLGKKLMVIPMKKQYEQQCNAAALKEMGVPVIKSLKAKHTKKIEEWIERDNKVEVDFPDLTEMIINMVIEEQGVASKTKNKQIKERQELSQLIA